MLDVREARELTVKGSSLVNNEWIEKIENLIFETSVRGRAVFSQYLDDGQIIFLKSHGYKVVIIVGDECTVSKKCLISWR